MDKLLRNLLMDRKFFIYGAGIVAMSTYTAIKHLYQRMPVSFLVSSMEGNPCEIDGVSVCAFDEIDEKDKEKLYIIATPEAHHNAIAEMLCARGGAESQLIFIDNKMENRLMEAYFRSRKEFTTVAECLTDDSQKADIKGGGEIKVFQAKCHVDKPLQSQVETASYVCPIQVGTSLTEQKIVSLLDNQGENISYKNRNYCELTASYWAWKNSDATYKGLCHYRRIFDLTDEQIKQVLGYAEVDVILPYPSIYYPNMYAEHSRYVKTSDWDAMLQALCEVAPEYYKAYVSTISQEPYFYNYNMLIARREVFDDYCRFLFSVLERTEELASPKGVERADRFAGYLGENLTTIYFRKNKDKWKIAHTGKLWLV